MNDEISAQWKSTDLRSITSKIGSGATPRGGERVYRSSGIPLIRSMNVYCDGFRSDGLAYLDRGQASALDGVKVQAGDVLLNITGASIGRVTQAPPEMDGARVNQHVCIIRPVKSVDPSFVARYLASPSMQAFIAGENYGATRQALTKGMIENISLPIPPLDEQRRIVAKLDSLFAHSKSAREELSRISRLVERYRQAILAAAFRGDLTAEWRAAAHLKSKKNALEEVARARSTYFKHDNRKEKPAATPSWKPEIDLPNSWAWVSVDQLATLVQYGTSAKTSDVSTNAVPVLRMGNIVDGNLDYRRLKYLPRNHEQFPELLLKDGDILFNRTNSAELVGKTAVYSDTKQPTSFASYLIRVRVIGYLPELLSAYINSTFGRDWVRSVVNQQVGQANVNGTKLRELGVPLMSMEEQKELWLRINKAFSAIDDVARETTRAFELLDRLDQATLAKAFRGELISIEATDLPAGKAVAR